MTDEVRLKRKRRVERDMRHQEIRRQLPDYVLGLLAPDQANLILEHLSACGTCRQIVHDEREVGQLVRQTVVAATQPDPARLRQLMPLPGTRKRARMDASWSARLAPALVVLLLIAGALLMRSPDSKRPLPAIIHATATATTTNTPTATIAQSSAEMEERLPAQPIDTETDPIRPSPAGAPTPAATEIYMASN